MSARNLAFATAFLTTASLLIGCGQSSKSTTDSAVDDKLLMDELFTEASSTSADQSSLADPAVPVVPVARTAEGGSLELRLDTGDRFPLIKTIEQSLVQKPAEFAASAQTRLELHMTITVQQANREGILMHVQYTRIVYAHDVNGHRMAYDSSTHQGQVPEDAVPYAGMVNNGFSFWLGRDNAIRELVDYQQFLERCVSQVSMERRQGMLAEISARFGDDGVANFVDDAIGILPFDNTVDPESATKVSPGDVWTRERRLMVPVPVYMSSTCRLVSLNSKTAEIDITGRIAPGETYHDVRGDHSARIRIKGGQSFGACTVDRATGLPLELKRTRYLQLSVASEGGPTVEQDKRVITTIRAFPATRGPVVQNAPANQPPQTAAMSAPQVRPPITSSNGVSPVHGQQNGRPHQADQIPVQAPLGSSTRAVYPN